MTTTVTTVAIRFMALARTRILTTIVTMVAESLILARMKMPTRITLVTMVVPKRSVST